MRSTGNCKVLRGEWGFGGFVLSGYFGNYGYMDADRAIRGGTDVMLGATGNEAILTDQTSAASVKKHTSGDKERFLYYGKQRGVRGFGKRSNAGLVADNAYREISSACEVPLVRCICGRKRKRKDHL